MAKHTVASVAGLCAVLRKETDLQDSRITALETSTSSILQSQARVETNIKAMVRSTNGTKANGKKPKRVEMLTAVILTAVGLQTLGIPKLIGDMFRNWITGGG